MKYKILLLISSLFATGALAQQIDKKEIIEIMVTPYNITLEEGETNNFSANVYYDDGSFETLTDDVEWHSENQNTVSITQGGTAFGIAKGESAIFATLDGFQSPNPAKVTVTKEDGDDVILDSILLDMGNTNIRVGGVEEISATAFFSDGQQEDVTSLVDWQITASNNAITINDNIVYGNAEGYGYISGIYDGKKSAALEVQVNDTGYLDIIATPGSSTLSIGHSLTPSISAFTQDYQSVRLENTDVSYKIENSAVVRANNDGTLTAIGAGKTNVYVIANFVKSSEPIVVTVN